MEIAIVKLGPSCRSYFERSGILRGLLGRDRLFRKVRDAVKFMTSVGLVGDWENEAVMEVVTEEETSTEEDKKGKEEERKKGALDEVKSVGVQENFSDSNEYPHSHINPKHSRKVSITLKRNSSGNQGSFPLKRTHESKPL